MGDVKAPCEVRSTGIGGTSDGNRIPLRARHVFLAQALDPDAECAPSDVSDLVPR